MPAATTLGATWRARLPAVAFAALLLWAPLPWGSTPGWARAVVAGGAGVLLVLAALLASELTGLRPVQAAAWAAVGIGLLAFVQAIVPSPAVSDPLQPAALSTPMPSTIIDATSTPSIDGRVSRAWLPTSLAADRSRQAGLGWLVAGCVVAAAGIIGRERWGRRSIGAAVLVGGMFQVLYGAQLWFARSHEIWGVEVPSTAERLRGTFVNPDHTATFLLVCLTVGYAVLWWLLGRAKWQPTLDRYLLLLAPAAMLWLLLFVGLAFTGSRAGLVAGLVGVGCQSLLVASQRRHWHPLSIGLASTAAGIGLVVLLGFTEGLGRLVGTTAYEGSLDLRLAVAASTLDLWRRFPLFGCGLGAFADAFPLVQPAVSGDFWRHAHNDPAELLATGGLLAMGLLVFGLAMLLRRLAAVLRYGRRSEDRAGALAGLGVVAALVVQELFDFGLTLPANAVVVLAVLAAAAAAPAVVPAVPATEAGGAPPAAGGRATP